MTPQAIGHASSAARQYHRSRRGVRLQPRYNGLTEQQIVNKAVELYEAIDAPPAMSFQDYDRWKLRSDLDDGPEEVARRTGTRSHRGRRRRKHLQGHHARS
jgi:hypothetical protein